MRDHPLAIDEAYPPHDDLQAFYAREREHSRVGRRLLGWLLLYALAMVAAGILVELFLKAL